MIPEFIIRPRAVIDVADIFGYLAQKSPQAAVRFYDAYEAALQYIEKTPLAGSRLLFDGQLESDFYYYRPRGFEKYLVIYRASAAQVEVVRVLHGSRDLTDALQDR